MPHLQGTSYLMGVFHVYIFLTYFQEDVFFKVFIIFWKM